MVKRSNSTLHLLAGVVVLLLAWRLFLVGLDYNSMWFDEDYSWRLSRSGPVELTQATMQDVHPPTYYLLLWAWMTVTGSENLFIMRLSSAIPMWLSVALTYRLGLMWFRRYWVAWSAALFMSSMGMVVFYARNLRMYALIVMLLLISWWLLTRLLEGRRGGIIGYGLSLAAMAYTFYFAAFGVLAQALLVLIFFRHKFKQVALAYGVALLAFAPWLPVFFNQMTIARAQSGDEDAAIVGKFLGTIPTQAGSIIGFVNLYSFQQPAYVGLWVMLGLAAIGLAGRKHVRQWGVGVVLWFFFTVTFMFTLNLLIPIYSHRYTVIIAPALALLAGLGMMSLPTQTTRFGAVCVMLVTGVLSYSVAMPEENTPHHEMFTTINTGFQTGDVVWYNMDKGAYGSSIYGAPGEFHLYQDAPRLNPDGSDFVWAAPKEFQDPATAPRVWDARSVWLDYPADTETVMKTGRVLTEEYIFMNGYRVQLYEAPPTTEPIALGDVFLLNSSGTPKPTYQAGDSLTVKLWWDVQQPPVLDYSRVLQLRDVSGNVIMQDDGALHQNRLQGQFSIASSQWQADEGVRFSAEPLTLPDDLPAGTYQLWLALYYWEQPNAPLQAQGDSLPTDDAWVQIATFDLTAP